MFKGLSEFEININIPLRQQKLYFSCQLTYQSNAVQTVWME